MTERPGFQTLSSRLISVTIGQPCRGAEIRPALFVANCTWMWERP